MEAAPLNYFIALKYEVIKNKGGIRKELFPIRSVISQQGGNSPNTYKAEAALPRPGGCAQEKLPLLLACNHLCVQINALMCPDRLQK